MTAVWGPDGIARLRDRLTRKECQPDPIARWMARCSTDREFCRWVSTLDLDLTEIEMEVIDAVIEAGAVDECVLVPVAEYEALCALRLSVAIARLDSGSDLHVQPYRARVCR